MFPQALSGHRARTEQCCQWGDGHVARKSGRACLLAPGLSQLPHFPSSLALRPKLKAPDRQGYGDPDPHTQHRPTWVGSLQLTSPAHDRPARVLTPQKGFGGALGRPRPLLHRVHTGPDSGVSASLTSPGEAGLSRVTAHNLLQSVTPGPAAPFETAGLSQILLFF